jgi:hypothetical protein
MTERLANDFQPVERTHRSKDMGRIRALTATSTEQPSLSAGGEEGLKQEVLGIALNEACTELAQHRGVKTSILKWEGKQVSDSQGALLLPSLLRTGRAPLSASGSSKPYAARMSAPLTVGR